MSKDKTMRVFCGYKECHEIGIYSYKNRKEYSNLEQEYGRGKWRCVRHTNPDEVLSKTNLKRQTILVCGKSKKYPGLEDLFWNDGFGFDYGSGYKAYANDFPEDTKLIITVEIVLPELLTS